MIVIAGTVRVPPDKVEAALPHMEAMLTASRAEAGCVAYNYAQDVLDPGLIHVFEEWTDEDALKAHFETPHMADWRAVWPTLGVGDRNLTRYVVSDRTPL